MMLQLAISAAHLNELGYLCSANSFIPHSFLDGSKPTGDEVGDYVHEPNFLSFEELLALKLFPQEHQVIMYFLNYLPLLLWPPEICFLYWW